MLDNDTMEKLSEQGIDATQIREAVKPLFLLLHQAEAGYATIVRTGSKCSLTIGWQPWRVETVAGDEEDDSDDDDEDDFDDDDDEWWDDDDEEDDDDDDEQWNEEPAYETKNLRYLAETWEEVRR